MKRVKITESQYQMVQMLKENIDFAEKTKSKFGDIKKAANKLYSIITFSTIAEIRDGDTDVGIIEQKLEKLHDALNTTDRRVSDYFDRYDEDTYYAKKLDDIHSDLENRSSGVYKKLDALDEMVKALKPFSKKDEYGDGREKDWDTPFNDITPTEI